MSQLLIVEFFVKDQAGAATVWDILAKRRATILANGCEKIDWYVDQDDPNHLIYISQWVSRGHYDGYLKWAHDQPDDEAFRAGWASPPRHTWLDKREA